VPVATNLVGLSPLKESRAPQTLESGGYPLRLEGRFQAKARIGFPPCLNNYLAQHAVRVLLLQVRLDCSNFSAISAPLLPPKPGHECSLVCLLTLPRTYRIC
jgi:hypothetical protein